jgi:predicted Zn-dependent peptidase
MIEFEKHTLENGLTVLIHSVQNTPFAFVNTLYKVGARDENPSKTGFAHLFEHLMFSGSRHIPDFDTPVQRAGGQSNAFTNNDYTNYYISLPAQNLDTALWLESDRMLQLNFSEKSLEVQRKVVIEEFGQRYLNQPYGELWLELRPMAYKKHPYRWATIGKKVDHIREATLSDVRDFYSKYYHPSNAILSIAGDFDSEQVLEKVQNWYGEIPSGDRPESVMPKEEYRAEDECKILERDVAQNAIHLAWLMPDRLDRDFCKYDLLSDVLGNGKSSRLYKKLVLEEELFTQLSAYITGSVDRGLFVISGMLKDGVEHQHAKESVLNMLDAIAEKEPTMRELEKVKNKVLTQKAVSDSGALARGMNLAYYEMLGSADMINDVEQDYLLVTASDIREVAARMRSQGMSELRYMKHDR